MDSKCIKRSLKSWTTKFWRFQCELRFWTSVHYSANEWTGFFFWEAVYFSRCFYITSKKILTFQKSFNSNVNIYLVFFCLYLLLPSIFHFIQPAFLLPTWWTDYYYASNSSCEIKTNYFCFSLMKSWENVPSDSENEGKI